MKPTTPISAKAKPPLKPAKNVPKVTPTTPNQTATYNDAKALVASLNASSFHHMKIKPETFDMKTSGIFIPRWIGYSRIPHLFDKKSGIAEWYFFIRFANGKERNVAEVLRVVRSRGIHKFAAMMKP